MADRADWLAVAVAMSVPWSTSATSILIVIWLCALVPTLSWSEVRRELLTAAGGLPVLLFLLGVLGMFWANVPWEARWGGLDGFVKLLVLPLLMVQFRRSENGEQSPDGIPDCLRGAAHSLGGAQDLAGPAKGVA